MNFVGIDIGGTGVKAGLVSKDGKILKKSSIETKATRKAEEVLLDIVAQIKELTKGEEYEGIGIGCPGAIDSKNGIVQYSPNLYWKDVHLTEFLSRECGKPCFVSNDANVAALGEVAFGAGKNYTDAVFITLGTGVGAGIVVDGKLFEGFASMGTEGGHIVIRENGLKCACGRSGCWEAYASANALIRETIYAMLIDRNSLMWQECNNDLNKVGGKTCFVAAKKGDKSAQEVVENYAKAVAEGILDFVNVFRSQAIIIGGGVSAQGEALTKPVQEYVDAHRYGGKTSLRTMIHTATLGNDAGVLGAVALCIQFLGL